MIIDPKKIRRRWLIVGFLIMFFIIGFLKTHVFAWVPCTDTNPYLGDETNGYSEQALYGVTACNLDYSSWQAPGLVIAVNSWDSSCHYVHAGIYMFPCNYNLWASPPGQPAIPAATYQGQYLHYWGKIYVSGYWFMSWGIYRPTPPGGGGGTGCLVTNVNNPTLCTAPKTWDSSICGCACPPNSSCPVACQVRELSDCDCVCPSGTQLEGNRCVSTVPDHVYNTSKCADCDLVAEFGADYSETGVYWVPYAEEGVSEGDMFYGTDKTVDTITWECLSESGGRSGLSLSEPLMTYGEIKPELVARGCLFNCLDVLSFSGVMNRTESTYVWFGAYMHGTSGNCEGVSVNVHSEGYVGEIKDCLTEDLNHGTAYHSEYYRKWGYKGAVRGGYEVELP